MKYYWKVLKWASLRVDCVDYTEYLIAPVFIEEKLDETLDSGEIILEAMPAETRAAFQPKTKFRIERFTDIETKNKSQEEIESQLDELRDDTTGRYYKRWDMVVDHDDVEEYPTRPDICTHRITLIEASVVAQGMHVDNIALTYELQDVDLNYRTTLPDEGATIATVVPGGSTYPSFTNGNNGLLRDNNDYVHYTTDRPGLTYFDTNFKFVWSNTSSFNGMTAKINAGTQRTISFNIPTLTAYAGTGSDWQAVCEMPTRTTVTYKKYKQRATQDSDGRYIADQRYSPEEVASGTLVDRTSYPASDSSFVELRGRTKKVDGKLTICETPYSWKTYTNYTSIGGYNIIVEKWVENTGIQEPVHRDPIPDDTIYNPISAPNSSSHYTSASFTTFAMADEEAVFEDDYGNVYICWYEYEVRTREAVYAVGGFHIPARQYYLCRSYWQGVYFTFAKEQLDTLDIYSYQNRDSSIYVETNIYASVETVDVNGGKFLTKAQKYSCYELLKKALLTIDTQVINNSEIGLDRLVERYPITISDKWVPRLQVAIMQETIFEQKNLWEVLLQIGYYLHAIPYLEFADDGTDRFLLSFRQLGDTRRKADDSVKLTVFNSQNLSDYFTQYDSYVTNLFSPQNVVDEWLVVKTSDKTYLVSNDTAELHTSRPIMEILEFDLKYGNSTRNAISTIFEESVYEILASDNPKIIQPAKGNSIYYRLGDNKILGLNYVPPAKNNGTYYYALQEICRRLFGSAIGKPEGFKFNDLLAHIKYRTQDELRISQVRPDIQNFMRNSSLEKYPHHEQFYGQQDKIIDSERFTENLFGQLIRVGNTEYQRFEYALDSTEKESGDLVMLYGEPYYVTATENEYYNDAILQKVTYSKNFNQLAKIVTIPSEPRFYEVSERSKVRREVRLMEFLELSTTPPSANKDTRYLSSAKWKNFIKGLIFNTVDYVLPNFAYTKYMADVKREHIGGYGQIVPIDSLFPSSDVIRESNNSIKPQASSSSSQCVVPLLHYPTRNGIVFEWDMEDNFKVGDFIDSGLSGVKENGEAYVAQQSYRYVDVMGRADLFTFRLFIKTDWTLTQSRQLPKASYIPTESESVIYLPSPYTIGLDKDNREALSFNFQINLLHRPTESDSEDFITFSNLFGQKESPLKMCLLSEPQSMFNQNVNANLHNVLAGDVSYSLVENSSLNAIEIRITTPSGVDLNRVKAIALYEEESGGRMYAYVVKNVENLQASQKLRSWWIYPVFSD